MKRNIVFLFLFFSFSILQFSAKAADNDYLFSPKGIAEIHITLHNDKVLSDIKRDEPTAQAEKLSATMEIKNSATSSYAPENLYNGLIEIKGRGNTSWGNPKKSYSVDLVDSHSEDNPAPLLGMPADEEWVLLAYWADRSYMRNPLAYYIGSKMSGIGYAARTRYVELFVNNEYRGVYSLVEKIKRGKDRVNISKLSADAPDQVAPRVSGGYIAEAIPADRMDPDEKSTSFRSATRNINFVFKYPKPKNVTSAQRQWFISYLNQFESVIYGSNYKDPVNGYLKYIDEDNFIDWAILHELSKGVDNLFHCSVFIHKDRDGKLHMSVPWDFDISFGNHGGSCYTEDEMRQPTTHWFNRLFTDQRFILKYNARYDALAPLFDQIPQILEVNLRQLEESGALDRDNEAFPKELGEFKDKNGNTTPTTHRGHVRWLKEWIDSRRTWIYFNLGLKQEERCERFKQTKPAIRVIDPESYEAGLPSMVKVMGGYTTSWDSGKSSSYHYLIADDKEHSVQMFDTHGCASLITTFRRGAGNTSIGQHLAGNSAIRSYLVGDVLFTNYATDKLFTLQLHIYNVDGVLLRRASYAAKQGFNQHETSVAGLPAGIYIIQCVAGNEIIKSKIMVK